MGICDAVLRQWHSLEQTFEKILQDPTKRGRILRQYGGGRKPMYPELEAKVVNAIADLKNEGVSVTGKMITSLGLKFKAEIVEISRFQKDGWLISNENIMLRKG
jgi:hypothetical protein